MWPVGLGSAGRFAMDVQDVTCAKTRPRKPMRHTLFALILSLLPVCLAAQEFRALARILPEDSQITDVAGGVDITLSLTQSVPFRVLTRDGPARVEIATREVDWSGLGAAVNRSEGVAGVLQGRAPETPGWSRLILTLRAPFAVETASMATDAETGAAQIVIRLVPTDAESFRAAAVPADIAPHPAPAAEDRFVVALDPGHGGVDPGAVVGELREADLMLTFARELTEALVRTGLVEVVPTRTDDSFVSLPERISIARAGGADMFLSLHADALAEGNASGATVYTLSDEASDAASASLAQQHDRMDLLQGVDLTATDDAVAAVLMELARRDTAPRAAALADRIVAEFRASGVPLHVRPRLEAGFSVLRAADIPSVLLEVGFMSNPEDRARIEDPAWRAEVQAVLVTAILGWAEADAVRAGLSLQ